MASLAQQDRRLLNLRMQMSQGSRLTAPSPLPPPFTPQAQRRLIEFEQLGPEATSSQYGCSCCVEVDVVHPDFFDGRDFIFSSRIPVPRPAPGSWGCVVANAPAATTSAKADPGRVNVVPRGLRRFEIGKVAPPQPNWERLSDRVICVLGQNRSIMTLNGTCCYLVGTGPRRILIDTGEDSANTDKMIYHLDEAMKATGCVGLELIIITHMHHDHFGGVEKVAARFGPGIPVAKLEPPSHSFETIRQLQVRGLVDKLEATRAASDGDNPMDWHKNSAAAAVLGGQERVEWDTAGRTEDELRWDYWYIKKSWDFHSSWKTGVWGPCHVLQEGELITVEGATLRCLHTPGHAEDHCSFLLEEEQSLFSGDQVLGFGTTFQQDLFDYMATLHRMLSLQPTRLFPGHGPTIDDSIGFLNRYIQHRNAREEQVMTTLIELRRAETMAIVLRIYTGTPKERLWMARENVEKNLRKLEKDGRVQAWLPASDTKDAAPRLRSYKFPPGFVRRFPAGLVWTTE